LVEQSNDTSMPASDPMILDSQDTERAAQTNDNSLQTWLLPTSRAGMDVTPIAAAPRAIAKNTAAGSTSELTAQGNSGARETTGPATNVAAIAQTAPAAQSLQSEKPTVSDQIAASITERAETTLRDGRTDFHLRLDPPELGTVRIHLTATAEGISGRFIVHGEVTRQLIEGQLHTLRQALSDSGISLGGFDVSRDASGSARNWAAPDFGGAARRSMEGASSRPVISSQPAVSRLAPGRIDVVI
jgi:flagellar hook-length control protein FliK